MLNKGRRFCISDTFHLDELAMKLSSSAYCLCTGFLSGGLLLLNDTFIEEGAQEYAVFRCSFTVAELEAEPRVLAQMESITLSWMNADELCAFLYHLAGKVNTSPLTEATRQFANARRKGRLLNALQGGTLQIVRPLGEYSIKTHPRSYRCSHCQ